MVIIDVKGWGWEAQKQGPEYMAATILSRALNPQMPLKCMRAKIWIFCHSMEEISLIESVEDKFASLVGIDRSECRLCAKCNTFVDNRQATSWLAGISVLSSAMSLMLVLSS